MPCASVLPEERSASLLPSWRCTRSRTCGAASPLVHASNVSDGRCQGPSSSLLLVRDPAEDLLAVDGLGGCRTFVAGSRSARPRRAMGTGVVVVADEMVSTDSRCPLESMNRWPGTLHARCAATARRMRSPLDDRCGRAGSPPWRHATPTTCGSRGPRWASLAELVCPGQRPRRADGAFRVHQPSAKYHRVTWMSNCGTCVISSRWRRRRVSRPRPDGCTSPSRP